MTAAQHLMRPLAICSRCLRSQTTVSSPLRAFSSAETRQQPATTQSKPTSATYLPLVPTDQLDPNLVSTVSEEARLLRHHNKRPIGSRRRRAVLSSLSDDAVPFTQLPYQCFQEARALLAADREEKVKQIEKMRKRIAHVEGLDEAKAGGEPHRQHRLKSMRKELEELKILADINDPVIKKRFEDGMGAYRILTCSTLKGWTANLW